MSRYRPPARPGSKYITPAGHERLRTELDQLWRVERPQVTARRQRRRRAGRPLGKRRVHLRQETPARNRLPRAVPAQPARWHDGGEQAPTDRTRVFFGAWVELEDEAGNVQRHRIVGPDEFDREPGYISMDAPLARALMGKALDSEITLQIAGVEKRFVIIKIEYE